MDVLIQDLRYGWRTLRRAPGVMFVAVLCMALGIGSVTTMFGTASAFTFRPLPQVRGASRVLHVWESLAADPRRFDLISPGAFLDARRLGEFSAFAAIREWEANIAGMDLAERVEGAQVSASLLRTLGRAPALGRDFTEAEDAPGAGRVVLLGHGLWQRRFGGDTTLLGRTVRINGEAYSVAGILPDDFLFPVGAQILTPLRLGAEDAQQRRDRNLLALARLAPGVSAERAAVAVRALGARLAAQYPEASQGRTLEAERAERYFGSGPRPFMLVLLASAGFVLLIACANVANLLLVRATTRHREIAVRVALGASRGRVVRQLLTESVLVSLAGGVLGALLAVWGLSAVASAVPAEVRSYIPGFGRLELDGWALLVTTVVAVGSGLLFGLAPAVVAARADVQRALKEEGRTEAGGSRTRHVRGALVVAEVALALVLLVGATLMLASFRRLSLTDPGFRTAGVLTFGVTLPAVDYPSDSTVTRFYRQLEDRVAELPGVAAAGATTVLPMSWNESRTAVEVEGRQPGRPEDAPRVGYRAISPGYLPALGIPLRRGRAILPQDGPSAPAVALVSEAAARKLWPGEDALGKRLRLGGGPWIEVAGIVGDVRGNVLTTDDPLPVLYVPFIQRPGRSLLLVVRTGGDPVALAPEVQRAVSALDARLGAGDISPMSRVVLSAVSPQRATAQSLVLGALIALLMAAVGTYGVMAYAVAQRTREIGVRVALGATACDIVRLVLGQGMRLAGIGIVAGIAGAVAMGRLMRAILFETDPSDPLTIVGVATLLLLVALVANVIPARRVLRVNPLDALRSE